MPRAQQLTPEERRVILDMLQAGQNISDTADAVNSSFMTVYSVQNSPVKLTAFQLSCRPMTLPETKFRRLMLRALLDLATAQLIKTASNCTLSVCRIQHYKQNDKNLAY